MIQALIFDCDGTLTDSMPVHYEAWRKVLSVHGLELAEDRFYSLGGIPTPKIARMLTDEHGSSVDPALISKQKEQAFLAAIHDLQPIPAILEVARQHRGAMKMAVASGGLRHVILEQLTRIGCVDWFDTIVTAEDTERHKPHPDVFLEAARRLHVEPQYCRVYEDADPGVEAARRAGMEVVDVRTIHTPRRVTPQTDVSSPRASTH